MNMIHIIYLDFLTDLDFFIFCDLSSTLVHEYPTGIAKGSESNAIEELLCCDLLWWLLFRLSHADATEDEEEDDDTNEELCVWVSGFFCCSSLPSLSKCLGLEKGVKNCSTGWSSTNLVNVITTLTVGTTGIATCHKQKKTNETRAIYTQINQSYIHAAFAKPTFIYQSNQFHSMWKN